MGHLSRPANPKMGRGPPTSQGTPVSGRRQGFRASLPPGSCNASVLRNRMLFWMHTTSSTTSSWPWPALAAPSVSMPTPSAGPSTTTARTMPRQSAEKALASSRFSTVGFVVTRIPRTSTPSIDALQPRSTHLPGPVLRPAGRELWPAAAVVRPVGTGPRRRSPLRRIRPAAETCAAGIVSGTATLPNWGRPLPDS